MADMPPAPSPVAIYLFPKGGRATEAIALYKAAFNAEVVNHMPAEDGKRVMHAHLRINGGSVMLSDEFPEMPRSHVRDMGGFTIHLQVDDADAWQQRAAAAGCTISSPVEEQFWGERYGSLRDPFGVDWSLASPSKK
jgi:PhnB protein